MLRRQIFISVSRIKGRVRNGQYLPQMIAAEKPGEALPNLLRLEILFKGERISNACFFVTRVPTTRSATYGIGFNFKVLRASLIHSWSASLHLATREHLKPRVFCKRDNDISEIAFRAKVPVPLPWQEGVGV